METVNYFSPLLPVEWIRAHGLHARRLIPGGRAVSRGALRGLCPFAAAVMEECASLAGDALTVLASSCDQLRHVGAALHERGRLGIFLFTLPATWQTVAADNLYRAELRRLGGWLIGHGGQAPRPGELAGVLRRYDAARQAILSARDRLSGKELVLALAEPLDAAARLATRDGRPADSAAIRLALVGGPMLEHDCELYPLIERLGGRIALNGMEGGERTIPALSAARVDQDPLAALVEAYGRLPDAFRRPDHRLHQWLREELAARRIEGLVLWRYVWCDLWHAERWRLEHDCGVPVLDLDADLPDGGVGPRLEGRIEAFLETLQQARRVETWR